MFELTIAIPSYNRPEKLLATLRALLTQLNPKTQVYVFDNGSDTEYQDYVTSRDENLAAAKARGQLVFSRNAHNVGMSANFLRAYEGAQTEWMWLLSDDDHVPADAIENIFREIEHFRNDPEVALVKFSSKGCAAPADGDYLRTLPELIERLAVSHVDFNSYIFISNSIYRFPHFKSQIETGYKNLHTYVPHLMMVIDYLAKHEGSRAVYRSPYHVAAYVKPQMGYHYGFVAGLGVGAFKNFPYNLSRRDYLRLENVFACHNDFKVAIDLFYHARLNSNMFVARRLIDNYYLQIRNARGLAHRLFLKTCSWLCYTPFLFEFLVNLLPRLSSTVSSHIEEIKLRNRRIAAAKGHM